MTMRSIVTSKMTRLLSATHGCVFAEVGTRGGTNRPAEKYAGVNGDMNGKRVVSDISDPAASVGGSRGSLRKVDGVWEMDPTASCGEVPSDEGDREEAEDDVTDDDPDSKEQRDDDGGVDDDVPPGIADGSIMHGGLKRDTDTARVSSVSAPFFDFAPLTCLPSLRSPPADSILVLLVVVLSMWLEWGTAQHPLTTRMVTVGTTFLLISLLVLLPNRETA